MMKKFMIACAALLSALTASAQYQGNYQSVNLRTPFEQGKVYIGASTTGLNLNYNGDDGFNLGVEAKGGIFFADDLLLHANVAYTHNGTHSVPDYLSAGAGVRYYIMQNGIFLGVNGKYIHAKRHYNDFMPGVELGYAYFVNRTVTIEPSIYYDQSFRNHSKYSTFGFKLGLGLNF